MSDMHKCSSIPIQFGHDKSLHLVQQTAKLGFLDRLKSGFKRNGVIHVRQVAAGEQAVFEVLSDGKKDPTVESTESGNVQKVTITTSEYTNMEGILKWPVGSQLDRLDINTEEFGVVFGSDLSNATTASDKAAGVVDFQQSREAIIATASGHVSGVIPMDALLDISSASGNVFATLMQRQGAATKQSKLRIKTTSGNIKINEGVDAKSAMARVHLPSYACNVSIGSVSGAIKTLLGTTQSAAFESVSGPIQLHVLPAGDGGQPDNGVSKLTTTTVSGSHSIVIADQTPAQATGNDVKIHRFCAHNSTSGRIGITYPSWWEGKIDARSVSSSINIRGDDVQIEKRPGHVQATKGTGGQSTEVKSTSGAIEVSFA